MLTGWRRMPDDGWKNADDKMRMKKKKKKRKKEADTKKMKKIKINQGE